MVVGHALAHRLGPDGTAWPSLATIARDTSLGISTVKRALRDLEDDGVITRTRRMRADGSAASTVYAFCGQLDLFKSGTTSARRAEGLAHSGPGGLAHSGPGGRPTVGQADFVLKDDHSERRAREHAVENHGDGPNGPDLADVVEAQCARAAELGHRGPWSPRAVRAFLDERNGPAVAGCSNVRRLVQGGVVEGEPRGEAPSVRRLA